MSFFFFNDTATTEIYTLSLHDALPISIAAGVPGVNPFSLIGMRLRKVPQEKIILPLIAAVKAGLDINVNQDRKSTRLNSSHANISYAVFCLKKKKKKTHSATNNRISTT